MHMTQTGKPKCSFCKKVIEALYFLVDGKYECSDCFHWLNQLIKNKLRKQGVA